MATIATDGSNADVQAKHNLGTTVDGDVLTIPTGSFTWTAGVSFTKRITLQGNTVINGNHEDINTVGSVRTTAMTATDLSIIKDAVASRGSSGYVVKYEINGSLGDATIPCMIKGLTFQPDPSVTTTFSAEGVIRWNGTGTSPTVMRLTNCHFNFPKWGKTMKTLGWVTGVVDHNINHSNGAMFALIWADWYLAPGMTSTLNGHGSWADYPKFGSGDFLFFEDNAFIGPDTGGGAGTGNFDSKQGARFVSRYNQWFGSKLNSHGTGAGPQRGVRAVMQYGDTTYYSFSPLASGELRSGSGIFHDNTNWGTLPNNNRFPFRLQPDRPDGGQAGPEYEPMGGQSVWDKNADSDGTTQTTDVDGSSIEGHIFASGAANDNQGPGVNGLFTVTMKVNPGWTGSQWVGYSIRNETWEQFLNNGTPQKRTGIITASTANTLTYQTYASGDFPKLQFRLDDVVAIRKPLQGMDEPGRGKGDLLVHIALPNSEYDVRNTANSWNKSTFPRNQEERIFTWNLVHTPTGTPIVVDESLFPTIVNGVNYDNLGNSETPFEVPAEVTAYYDSAKNGPTWGAYTEDYPYPHPLVSETPVTGPRIDVPVSHDYGNVIVSITEDYSMPVTNPGDATLVVASISATSGYSVLATAFNVAPGTATTRVVQFKPTAQQSYPGTVTVTSDADSGNNAMTVAGVGVPEEGGGGGGKGKGHKKGALSRRQ